MQRSFSNNGCKPGLNASMHARSFTRILHVVCVCGGGEEGVHTHACGPAHACGHAHAHMHAGTHTPTDTHRPSSTPPNTLGMPSGPYSNPSSTSPSVSECPSPEASRAPGASKKPRSVCRQPSLSTSRPCHTRARSASAGGSTLYTCSRCGCCCLRSCLASWCLRCCCCCCCAASEPLLSAPEPAFGA